MDLLACIGLMFILKYGTILNFPRKIVTKISFIRELFKCSLCLGFWSGVIVYFISKNEYILFPFASAGVFWIIDNFNNVLQSIEIKLDKEDS